MNFAVGYNYLFEDQFLNIVSKNNKISEIYFSYNNEISGRKSLNIKATQFLKCIRTLKSLKTIYNKKLNLLLNALIYPDTLLFNIEENVLTIINNLKNTGCMPDIVTVSIPYIGLIIKKHFPNIDIRASVILDYLFIHLFLQTDNIFDSYYVSPSVQRNIKYLEIIKSWFKKK